MEVATKLESTVTAPAETKLALAELALASGDEITLFQAGYPELQLVAPFYESSDGRPTEESQIAALLFERLTEELELNKSQAIALQNLMLNAGEWLPYSAITKGIPGIANYRRRAARELASKINASDYSGHLQSKGARVTLRHQWQGPALDPSHIIETEPEEDVVDLQELEADTKLLGQYGFGLSYDERKWLEVDGATLELDEHAVSTVIAIARRAGRTTFRALEQDPALKKLAPKKIVDRLTESLESIESVMQSNGVAFRNLRIPTKGKTVVRSIALGNFEQTQPDGPHDLSARERRELRLKKFMEWAKDTIFQMSDWDKNAACLDGDIDQYFVDGAASSSNKAKELCGSCPVRMVCLAASIVHEEEFGVFGGLTARERKAVLNNAMRHGVQSAADKISSYQKTKIARKAA